ncbi:restriction endonuclease, partial [Pelomonas saccharophila]|nr:restriction endonuclease [Roseateles saccharophilus]
LRQTMEDRRDLDLGLQHPEAPLDVGQALVALEHLLRRHVFDVLEGMSWREFEMLVGEGFRMQGYRVAETGGGGPDGGVDLVLTRPAKNGTEKYLVQCKQWRAFKVGVEVVRELYGAMAARGAAGGFVVTSGRFTEDAVAFASGRNVTLVDGTSLQGLLRQARSERSQQQAQATDAQASQAEWPLTSALSMRPEPLGHRLSS